MTIIEACEKKHVNIQFNTNLSVKCYRQSEMKNDFPEIILLHHFFTLITTSHLSLWHYFYTHDLKIMLQGREEIQWYL